jgi:hypothetical protein
MSMLVALANLAYRRPRAILGAALLIAVVAAAFGASTPSRLRSSDNDFQDSSSQSFRTLQLLSRATGVLPGPSLVVVATLVTAGGADAVAVTAAEDNATLTGAPPPQAARRATEPAPVAKSLRRLSARPRASRQ